MKILKLHSKEIKRKWYRNSIYVPKDDPESQVLVLSALPAEEAFPGPNDVFIVDPIAIEKYLNAVCNLMNFWKNEVKWQRVHLVGSGLRMDNIDFNPPA